MAALTGERRIREEKWKRHLMTLAAGGKVWKGAMACLDTADGTIKQGQASTTLIHVGRFAESVDNSAGGGAVQVNVEFEQELAVQWWDNDSGGTPLAAADVGGDAYILDDHTVTKVSTGHSKAGRVWAIDINKGVAVQALAHGL